MNEIDANVTVYSASDKKCINSQQIYPVSECTHTRIPHTVSLVQTEKNGNLWDSYVGMSAIEHRHQNNLFHP